ncbi:hypothetical protein FNF27_02989 [Cafeteria roenbergensis]|nr:hypothetical protein FNF29_02080 [Cafeteria roenbergensis]KAA0175579.1 hypothetical protein FNF27_02989 [Cafeteria roenbergensis]|eukprot:KAA0154936.1 hypothetical protein FNF29_02080 [Cafeteria roenbergensis]
MDSDSATCSGCKFSCRYEDLSTAVLACETHSKQRELPLWQRSLLAPAGGDGKAARALVDEPCPKCAHSQMFFYTMQMRSADEGQTVFFECPKCGHNYSVNA